MEKRYIGLDIGKTKLACGIVDSRGKVLSKKIIPSPKNGKEVLKKGRELVEQLVSISPVKLSGIGIGTTGIVDPESGHVNSKRLEWHDLDIKRTFSRPGLPVMAENDVNCAALAEQLYGAGKGKRSSAFITMSTGVKVTAIIEGRIWHGTHNSAGEIGRINLLHVRSHVEGEYSGRGIAEKASNLIGRVLSTEEVFSMAGKGHGHAATVINDAVESAALTIAFVQTLVDPEIIIVGGSIAHNQRGFIRRVKQRTDELLERYMWLEWMKKGVTIRHAVLGQDGVMIGAASLFGQRR